MSISLQPAKETDLPAIAAIMNAAFRGALAEQSWSFETSYITGNRTSEALLQEVRGRAVPPGQGGWERGPPGLRGLQASTPGKWYLGSLTVDPALQNTGFGRKLLCSAEEYAVERGALVMEMTVVNVRNALISWYERRGYHRTGATRPFPYGDNRFGTPTRKDLEFIVLEKHLRGSPDPHLE